MIPINTINLDTTPWSCIVEALILFLICHIFLTAVVCVSIAAIDYGKYEVRSYWLFNCCNARCAHRFSINAVTILKSLFNNSSYSFCRAARRGTSTARCQDAAKSRSGLGEFNSVSAISSFSLMAAMRLPIWIVRIVGVLLLVLGRRRQ